LTDNPPKDNTEYINDNYFIYKPGFAGEAFKTSDGFIYIYANKVDFILPGKFAQINENMRNDYSVPNRPIGLNRFLINNIVYDFYGNPIKKVDESFYTPNYINSDNYAKFIDSYFDAWLTYDNLRNVRTAYLKTKVIFNNNIFKKFGYIKKHDRFKIAYDNKKGNKVGYIISGTNNSSFGYHQKLAVNNQITLNNYIFLTRVVYNKQNDSFMALAEKNDEKIYLIKTGKIKKGN
jgi:hypothetical protein